MLKQIAAVGILALALVLGASEGIRYLAWPSHPSVLAEEQPPAEEPPAASVPTFPTVPAQAASESQTQPQQVQPQAQSQTQPQQTQSQAQPPQGASTNPDEPAAAPAQADAPAAPEPEPKTEKADAPAPKGARAARDLFGAKKLPSIGEAAAIGYYPKGCLTGGVALPANGPNWQVMRLSRNRNWGHPNLIRFVETFAAKAAKATGWKGILVGDLAQPRGGPAVSGHASHQTGLDVDIWFMPMPDHRLTRQEREDISASNLVSDDWKGINPKTWSPQYINFIRTAAQSQDVERVLVNAAIKKELCRVVGPNTGWLKKVRPWYGHHDHIHVRIACPEGSTQCKSQPPVGENDDTCGKGLDYWFSDKVLKPVIKLKPKKPLTMADLPPACRDVLAAPSKPR